MQWERCEAVASVLLPIILEMKRRAAKPAAIEYLIQQVRAADLEPAAKAKIERLLRMALTLFYLQLRGLTSLAA